MFKPDHATNSTGSPRGTALLPQIAPHVHPGVSVLIRRVPFRAAILAACLATADANRAAAAEPRLLLHFDFNGTVKPVKALGRHEPLEAPENPRFVKGVQGQAVLLEKQRIVCQRVENLDLAAGTLLLWMQPVGWDPKKTTDTYEWTFAAAGMGADGDRLQFFKLPQPMLGFFMGREGHVKQLWRKIGDWKKDQWRFFGLTWGFGRMSLFVDGQRVAETGIAKENIPVDTGPVFRLQAHLPVAFDELRIYDAPLSEDAMEKQYLRGRTGRSKSSSASVPFRPLIVIPRTTKSPVIDGVVKSGEWDGTSRVNAYLGIPELLLAAEQTSVRLCYDDANLYMLFESPVREQSVAGVRKHDGPVWSDPSHEILFTPTGTGPAPVAQLIFNVRDVHFDQKNGDKSWDPAWVSRSGVHDGVWRAEVRIPLAGVCASPPSPGDMWRFNFGRNFQGPTRFTNPAFALAYADLRAFWTVCFGGNGDWVDLAPTFDRTTATLSLRGSVGLAKTGAGQATVEIKRSDTRIVDRRRIGSFDSINGKILVQEEFTPDGPGGESDVRVAFKRRLTLPGDYFCQVTVRAGRRTQFRQIIPFRVRPKLLVRLRTWSKDKRLEVHWEAAGAPLRNATVRTEVLDAEGVPVLRASERVRIGRRGMLLFDISSLLQVQYKVVTTLNEGGTKTTDEQVYPCFANADWIGFSKSIQTRHRVPSPWKSIEIDETTVRTLTQELEFGTSPLPVAMHAGGTSLLARPMRLVVQTGASTLTWSDARKWTEHFPDRVAFRQSASGDDASAIMRTAVEFDGMIRYDLTIAPTAESVVLKSVVLDIPVRTRIATLKYPYRGPYQKWDILDLPAEVAEEYHEAFTPHFWVGNDECGIAWFTESDEPCNLRNNGRFIELRKTGDSTVLRVTWIDLPVKLTVPLTITFGVQPTPTRPLPVKNWFAYRYASCISTPNVHLTTGYTTGAEYHVKPGVPFPAQNPDRARKMVRDTHTRPNRHALVYATSNGMGGNVPEFKFFEQEWKNPAVCDTWTFASHGYYHWGTCPTVRTLRDFFLWSTAKAIEEYGIDGLYYDYGTVMRATNLDAGCGYLRNGKLRPTWPIFADRELRRLVYQLFMEKKGHAWFVLHNYSQMMAPIASFMTVHLDGESYQRRLGKVGAKITDDYTRLITIPRLRAMFGTQFGTIPYFLPELAGSADDYGTDWMKRATRTMIALMLPHGIPIWGFYCDIPELNRYVSAEDRFGFEDSLFIPYYRQTGELRLDPDPKSEKVLVSYWRKPDDLLIVIGNIGVEDFSGELILDCRALFERRAVKLSVQDACRVMSLPTTGNRVHVAVRGKDYILLRAGVEP